MPNLGEIHIEIAEREGRVRAESENAWKAVRGKYMMQLHQMTGRNIIAYYSGWLSKKYSVWMTLTDEDKNGFMECVHKLDRSKGLDLILHTPGGNISATQSLVHYLRSMFGDDIRAIVPQMAMSAGTMLACSCKSIVMGKQSNLGPIDPQLNGVPAHSVKEEFNRAAKEIVDANGVVNGARALLWQKIIGQYHPTFLIQCENAIKQSDKFVKEQLKSVMFKGQRTNSKKALKVVRSLTGNGVIKGAAS